MLRMCKYGSCRVQWEHTERGQGSRKYCKEHSKVVHFDQKKQYDRTKRLNRTSTVVSHG